MDIDYPFHFDRSGRTAITGAGDHVRDLIEQLLFTSPGERVNRPDFGSGLQQMLFAPNRVEQLLTREYPPGAGGQVFEQAEFGSRCGDGFALDLHTHCARIDLQIAHADLLLRERRLEPAEHSLNAGHQLARTERLGDVVIRSQIETS